MSDPPPQDTADRIITVTRDDWMRHGQELIEMGLYHEASLCFGQVLRKDPDDAEARKFLAIVLERAGL